MSLIVLFSIIYQEISMDRQTNLIWLDLEMTGLEPDVNKIIEIATIVTDKDLNILAQGPNLIIKK